MAVNYATAVKTPRMQVMVDMIAGLVAAASTGTRSAGSLVIGTAALSGATGVLATIPLSTTPFTVSGAVATLAGVPLSATASATGTAALAELRNNAGTTICSGLTVGTSASDVIVTNTSINNGQTVTVTSGTLTHG